MKISHFLLANLFALAACNGDPKSPSDDFLIPQEQMATVVNEANSGDVDAVKKLIAHYEATSGNDAITEEWRVKARSLGDSQELYEYAAKLFTGARTETDPIERREMLEEALRVAKRSLSNHADASTQRLVEEITRSLNSM